MSKKGIQAYGSPDFSVSVEERIRNVQRELISTPTYDGYDKPPLHHCTFISCSPTTQSCTWSLTVPSTLCNKSGNLHGGAATTILDSLTSTALLTVSKPGFLDAGHVSRALNMTFLRPVPVGTTCVVECEVVAAGKKTALVKGVIRLPDGKVAVDCKHDKVVFQKAGGAKL